MPHPFPIVIESPADVWSGLDALLAWIEERGRDELSGHIGRMARLRQGLFDPAPPKAGRRKDAPPAEPEPTA